MRGGINRKKIYFQSGQIPFENLPVFVIADVSGEINKTAHRNRPELYIQGLEGEEIENPIGATKDFY